MGALEMRLLLLFIVPCTAYYIAIDEDKFPALTTFDGRTVDWSTGAIAALLDTSVAVRISARGLHFYDHPVDPQSAPIPCRRAPNCLCLMGPSSMAFPENSPPRYSYGSPQCGSSSGSREVVSDPSIYDLSVCDLVVAQADVIWRDGYIYIDGALQLPEWAYIITALAVLFLVVSLGQNIARIMGDDLAVTQPHITEAVCFALCVLLLSLNDPRRVFVAQHDRLMALVTGSYLVLHVARQAFDLVFESYVYTFNVITASLMLVTARLYCSFETPYATIFLVLLLTRLCHKIHTPAIKPVERFAIVTDSILISLHYRLSYRPSFWDPQSAPVYATAIVVLCFTVGSLTALHQVRAQKPPQPHNVDIRVSAVANNRCHFPALRAHGSDAGHNPLRFNIFH